MSFSISSALVFRCASEMNVGCKLSQFTYALQSAHCGPLLGPQRPSDPGITARPSSLLQYLCRLLQK